MQYRNTSDSYGFISILMHWTSALTVIGLFALGLWMVGLDYYSSWYKPAPHIHKSLGILLFIVTVARFLWRLSNPTPKDPPTVDRLQSLAAHAVHLTLYALLLLIMFSGYLISTADERPIEVFNWFSVPALITKIPNQEDLAGDIHFYLAWTLIALVVLHALAAIKHHLIDRDDILKRMLRPGSQTNKTP